MFEHYSHSALTAMLSAGSCAKLLGCERVDAWHILCGLAESPGLAQRVLADSGLHCNGIYTAIAEILPPRKPVSAAGSDPLPFSPETKRLLKLTDELRADRHHELVCTGHLLVATLQFPGTVGLQILERRNISIPFLSMSALREIERAMRFGGNELVDDF